MSKEQNTNYEKKEDMAKMEILAPWILEQEGGYVNDPDDRGGATNKGVTIATWRANGYDKNGDGRIDEQDIKLISVEDAELIMRKNFWGTWKADQIKSQSIANMLVDWVWASGRYGITIPQQLLGVKADGIVGAKTLRALGNQDPEKFFKQLKQRRYIYIQSISKSGSRNAKYRRGWLARLERIGWGKLTYTSGKTVRFQP